MTVTGSCFVQVVIAHPRPGSFAHALAGRAVEVWAAAGAEVAVHDLYAEGFDPVATADESVTIGLDAEAAIAATADPVVRAHRENLSRADHLVVAHPNWWGKPPAIMAGWLDRVVVPGIAYRALLGSEPEPLLKLRSVLVLNTGDTTPEREAEVFGDPLDLIWRNCVGAFLGGVRTERLLATPLWSSTSEQRAAWLDHAATLAARCADPPSADTAGADPDEPDAGGEPS